VVSKSSTSKAATVSTIRPPSTASSSSHRGLGFDLKPLAGCCGVCRAATTLR
jgi:hypothetical protein